MTAKTLGERMKEYEIVFSPRVLKKTPIIIRIDGKAFHTYTRVLEITKLDSPFCEKLHQCIVNTTLYLVSNIQNCIAGYTQSDEISLLLKDWDMVRTELWFDGKIQKLCSVTSSMASVCFAREIANVEDVEMPAFFDSRVFNLPMDEVTNYFIWRQQDAIRNSVSMYGRSFYSHKALSGIKRQDVIDKIEREQGKRWGDLSAWKRNGTFVFKTDTGNSVVDSTYPVILKNRGIIENRL